MSKAVEAAVRAENWRKARQLIRADLKKRPDSHWLISRLGLTFYEERAYGRSLSYSRKALKLAPECPLVLWDYAGTLQMLGKHRAALRVYGRLLARGADKIANGDCGEGRAWARGLIADCFYRQAHSNEKLKRHKAAIDSYRKHLKMRGPGCRSVYPIRTVRRELPELT
jgi:tetratricopeptide (TPR) repeat protein